MLRYNRENNSSKESIKSAAKRRLNEHSEIMFAYLHGSFINQETFRDIDVAVYLKELPDSLVKYEIYLESELMGALSRFIVDVKILNNAPLSFRYNVVKNGVILLCRDNEAKSNFQERTVLNYLDFLPHYNNYLEETIGLKI